MTDYDYEKLGRELWPGAFDKDRWGASAYSPILERAGNVLVEESDNDYQGDTFALIEKDGKFGFLKFGWGSCSGCDALQACSTYADAGSLAASIIEQIVWYDTAKKMIKHLSAADDRNEWYVSRETYKKFCKEAIKELKGRT